MIFLRLVRVFFEMIDVVDIVHSENPKKKILRCQVIESLFNKKYGSGVILGRIFPKNHEV